MKKPMRNDVSPELTMWLLLELKSPQKILIVEDDLERIAWFKKAFQGHDVYYAMTGDDALSQLNSNWSMVFLDHDLHPLHLEAAESGQHASERRYDIWQKTSRVPPTGLQVALQLSKTPQMPNVIIHSLNTIGSRMMRKVLQNAWNIPFNELQQVINYSD